MHLPRHGNRETADALSNLLRLGIREIQTQMPQAFLAIRVKRVAGYKRHVLLKPRFKEFLRIHALWQGDPQEQPTLRMSPGNFGRKKFLQSGKHHVTTFAINATDQLDVLVEEIVAGDLVGQHLDEGGSVQVSAYAGIIAGNTDVLGAVDGESLQSSQVGGGLD